MTLQTFWFILITILWVGYFFLEGFDFGVGMLLLFLAKNNDEKRVMINTIGPVWDGNEVWLLTAGGATFAAFPNWYATLFSSFYLPLLVILIALIIRGVAFEYRGKVDNEVWRKRWDLCIFIGSWVPTILWGVAFSNIVAGIPINKAGNFTGSIFSLLNPFALLGAVVFVGLFILHGLNYIALKTEGDIRHRAQKLSKLFTLIAIVFGAAYLLWNQLERGKSWTWVTLVTTALLLVFALFASAKKKELLSFLGVGLAIVFATICLFGSLYPNVMPSTTSDAFSLTINNASSTHYTLMVMSVVAVAMTPVVLIYQGWSYWIFRKRIGVKHIPPVHTPMSK